MNEVADNQQLFLTAFQQKRHMSRRMPAGVQRLHSRHHPGAGFELMNPSGILRKRADHVLILLFIDPPGALRPAHVNFRVRERGFAIGIEKPSEMVAVQMRQQNGLNVSGSQSVFLQFRYDTAVRQTGIKQYRAAFHLHEKRKNITA